MAKVPSGTLCKAPFSASPTKLWSQLCVAFGESALLRCWKFSLFVWEVLLFSRGSPVYIGGERRRERLNLSEFSQKNSRGLWRPLRRKSSSVPAGAPNFPAAVFLAGKCPNLGRDSILRCRKIGQSFSSSVEICRKTFPAGNFGQPQPSRVF